MLQGHRVNSKAALAAPGDYYVDLAPDGSPAALWALLPGSGTQVRVPAPTWEIEVHDNGTASVKPSIDSGDYHGFLTAGVWSPP